jgi:lipoyl synthase
MVGPNSQGIILSDENPTPEKPLHIKKPAWLKTKIPTGKRLFEIKRELRSRNLYTVCEEAKCPNIAQCWNKGTATFMILGETCTRACRFCNVKTGDPQGFLDENEPDQTAQSALSMKLKYAVITMVDRDDLADGGAEHVAKVISRVKGVNEGIKVEILAGDFHANPESLKMILSSRPEVFAHNMETVKRLSPRVRDARAKYDQSLKVLKLVKSLSDYKVYTKSALMLGLGETVEEVLEALQDMRDHDVDFVTLGQYLRPTKKHLSIKRFVPPEEFDLIKEKAQAMGFLSVAAGPLVRSSYMAGDFFDEAVKSIR